MSWIMVGVAGTTAVMSVAGGIQGAETTRGQARLKQRLNDMNADLVDQQADFEIVNGETMAARYQGVIDTTLGDQKAAFAGADVDINYGTAADIQGETKLTGALNLLDIKKQAQEKARGLTTQARGMRLGSTFSTMEADENASAQEFKGIMGGLDKGLSGYGKAMGK